MKLVRLSPVAHRLRSTKATTTHTTHTARTNTMAEVAVAAAADEVALGADVATSAHPLAHQHSCKT